jgi:LAO/AO transport system kinase
VSRIRAGDPRALARAISAVEDRRPESVSLLRALFPHTGNAQVIGITGAPGAGKSTLVDQLAKHYRGGAVDVGRPGASAGPPWSARTLGIVAVDPTSPFSGGAILGDRIRMLSHHGDAGIYIRSMATRGALGGLAATTADVAAVLDAAGRDLILIETVGVGQDEIDIVRLADITVVILVPGMGDDVQTIKAGIMEIADIFVINKSDREGAERVEREIRAMQSLAGRHTQTDWSPPIVKTVASDGKGIAELAKAIADYQKFLGASGLGERKRAEHWRQRLLEMLRDALLNRVLREQMSDADLARYAAEVAEHRRDPYELVDELVRGLSGQAVKSV